MSQPDYDFDDATASDTAGTPQGDGDFETDNLPSTGETTSGGQLNTGEADHRSHQAPRNDVPGPQNPSAHPGPHTVKTHEEILAGQNQTFLDNLAAAGKSGKGIS